jgi:S1-C subfamily serine protease
MKNTWLKTIAILAFVCLGLGTAVLGETVDSGQQSETDPNFQEIRAKAEKGDVLAQSRLGQLYYLGSRGIAKNLVESVKWYRKAAEQGNAHGQCCLGYCYSQGEGVIKDLVVAVRWYRQAAEQGDVAAQNSLGCCYYQGEGVIKDLVESVKWFRKAAEQGFFVAQFNLSFSYAYGQGVPKDYVEAYTWANLASAQGLEEARQTLNWLEAQMTAAQIAEAQRLSREFKPRSAPESQSGFARGGDAGFIPLGTGSGFFITEDGFLVTNEHVIKDAVQVRLLTSKGLIPAKVVKSDPANDLALLKADGRFRPLPITSSRAIRLGSSVATVGFPNTGLQGYAPKLSKGEIAGLSGIQDDPRSFQISLPVQPGNSGGALVDERGNVVGVVSAKLSAAAALTTSGAMPENVNYAVKSSFLLGFLESVPEVSAKLKDANTKSRKFEDVVKSAEEAAVLVLVY